MIFLWISLLTQCCVNTSHGAVAVEVNSAPSWPSRAHDLSPLLRTVRSPKDSDSALTGVWIFHFLGQKLLVSLIPWQNSKNRLCVFTFTSRWVVESYLIKSCFFVSIETVFVHKTLHFCPFDRSHKSFESCPVKQSLPNTKTQRIVFVFAYFNHPVSLRQIRREVTWPSL